MLRFGVLVLAAAVVAAVVAASAHAALFFLFKPTTARAGDLVTVRLGGTPATFTLDQRERPFQRPLRLYLVRNRVAGEISTRFDPRLHFIGALVPDRNVRGVLTFTVPPLDTDTYVVAAWCPGCAKHSLGRTFSVLPIPRVSRYRDLMGLRVRLPSAMETCPVTGEGRYGNGLLSTTLPADGVLLARREPDGSLFQKLPWLPRAGLTGVLTVRGERLDAPSPRMGVLSVNWGYASSGPAARGSWASAVSFPSEGCWRISGRVRDVTLSYVVKVVATP
ncbi:MAG TPA: hypothetical protein VI409_10240 [Gaiellaceae bacterium]|nr:hypothetical protein [Gaiellaceae bacterium]